jgi:primase-polymerase (primpol)-like protein
MAGQSVGSNPKSITGFFSVRRNSMTDFLSPKFEDIPVPLLDFKWAVFKAEPRPNQAGKFNKAPRSPESGKLISVNEPDLWSTLHRCKLAYLSGDFTGVGVLMQEGGWVAIDIDDYANLQLSIRQKVDDWIALCLERDEYLERSPSGKGIRGFVRGHLDGPGRKIGALEMYCKARFMTVTGHRLTGPLTTEGDQHGIR